MKLAIACDHAGFEYKGKLVSWLASKNYEVLDLGPDTEDPVDYPLYADKVCKVVLSKDADLGILICGTGIGMSIAANKHKGIRAGLCGDLKSARWTREHNDANVLCMGARIISYELAEQITEEFLNGQFLGGKHLTRVQMLEQED